MVCCKENKFDWYATYIKCLNSGTAENRVIWFLRNSTKVQNTHFSLEQKKENVTNVPLGCCFYYWSKCNTTLFLQHKTLNIKWQDWGFGSCIIDTSWLWLHDSQQATELKWNHSTWFNAFLVLWTLCLHWRVNRTCNHLQCFLTLNWCETR